MNNSFLEKKAADVRFDCLMAIYNSEIGNVGSCMSVIEILVALYYGEAFSRPILNYNPQVPGSLDQDFVVFSKEQAAPALYTVLAHAGFFSREDLGYIGREGSFLTARPNVKIPGVRLVGGGPGNGLAAAVGLALAIKLEKKNNRVFVVVGDGELQTGEIWEAAMAAAHYKLNNLVLLIDHNKVQGDGRLTGVMDIGSIQSKLDSFGWHVYQAMDGHSFDDILNSMMKAFNTNRKPVCIWANTICAKGVPFAEGKEGYRHAGLSKGEANELMTQFKAR